MGRIASAGGALQPLRIMGKNGSVIPCRKEDAPRVLDAVRKRMGTEESRQRCLVGDP